MLSSDMKQRINSTYIDRQQDQVELEARFGQYTGKGFTPGVTRQTFNRIRTYFDTQSQSVISRTTDYISGNIRKTISLSDPDDIVWIEKKRLWNQQDARFNIRYSMSSEIPVQEVPSFVPQVVREKNRISYLVFNNMVRIDLTMVNMIRGLQDDRSKDDTKYEVEVELVDPRALAYFEKVVTIVLHRVLDTLTLFTSTERDEIVAYVNRLLGSKRRDNIDHYPMVQARNLKMNDMVYGGLIGNDETGYSVTHKADGHRKILLFHKTGIWLISPGNSLNKIYAKEIPQLTGTILDGESVSAEDRRKDAPNSQFWYLAFDCLAYNNINAVQYKPHGIRMNYAQVVADMLKTSLITVSTKSFKSFTTPQEFFKVMREMFRQQEILPYKQDGFMFTPVNIHYNPHSDKHPLFKRVLTVYPDICKWKPQDYLTIDFLIRWKATPGGRKLAIYVNQKGTPVKFMGSPVFPYTDTIDVAHPLTVNLPNDTIVEYGWDYERQLFTPHRVRNDKTKPNKIDIALDVWSDIHRPISQETLEGQTFDLLRRYHNRIKAELFKKPLKQKKDLTLLDIGSGRGGDVSRWKKYSKIVAVEPNLEHIQELKRRIELHGMTDRVRIVHSGGEETGRINQAIQEFLGEKVDVISMMLSMSFFWSKEEMLDSLAQTMMTSLKEDGKIIFLTINGDLVEQTFEPKFDLGPSITRLDLGVANLEYFGDKVPKELKIDIRGSIVQDQTEWLVKLDDLTLRLAKYGFDLVDQERADKEKFLTEEEITMTQMYSSGMYVKTSEGEKLPSLGEFVPVQVIQPPQPIPYFPPTSSSAIPEVIETVEKVESTDIDVDEVELPGILPDTVEEVKVSWYDEKVVRIGAIADGSCFFHSGINGYYKPYQENADPKYRVPLVQKLRRDLAAYLEEQDPNDPNKIIWETAAGGQFVELYNQQLMGVDFSSVFDYPMDFSLNGLQRLLNSYEYLGNEIYQYASDVLGIDIYVMRLTDKDLYVHQNTSHPGFRRKSVVISGNGNHYETVGIVRKGLYQTLFEPDDPFIVAIRGFSNEEEENIDEILQKLEDMGFHDTEMNRNLLFKHNLNLDLVVRDLTEL